MLSREKIESRLSELCLPVVEAHGLELVQLLYRREESGWVLRVLIDRPGGVTVDDCGVLSRELSDLLDVEDLIAAAYHLEVSSPGLDRPLVKAEDFLRFSGREITVTVARPVEGHKNFRGVLEGLSQERLFLLVDSKRYELDRSLVLRANLVPVFNDRK